MMADESEMARQYQLLEELGSGSFGIVYKAIELATGEIVAIKHIDLESSEEDIQEIQGEINVLSTCASPYVTQYRTSFLRGSKLWIVMEFLGGGSCQDLLKPGPFNEAQVAIVCRELLLGLDYLHREGKIHRDIKAANVLLSQKGKVKLADFGVAAQLTDIKSVRNTFVGTPFWMAPEVIQEAGYDYRADIWSLGITAMELINGEPPNAAIHPMKVLFMIPKAPAPRLVGPQYSRDFKDFVAACLAKDPDRRPSAKDLLQYRFVRAAGKVEGLQELIHRRQMFDSERGRTQQPKYYEATLGAMTPVEEKDEWVFDTVKASTMLIQAPLPATAKRRKVSTAPAVVDLTAEGLFSQLSLDDQPSTEPPAPTIISGPSTPPSTMRRLSTKRRASPPPSASSTTRRRSSVQRRPSSQRKPLAPDMSFGNGTSNVRQFRRTSSITSQPSHSEEGLTPTDENQPLSAEVMSKEALIARRAYSKVVDHAFQEVYAQTGDYSKREAISRAAQAWNALDLDDPEGEFQILKLILHKVQTDPKLSSLLPQSQPTTPSKPKLVLAQNNPHLKSHKRRQSSIMPSPDPFVEKNTNLPGQLVPGMEHTKQLADVLYGKWIDGLKNRWPVVP